MSGNPIPPELQTEHLFLLVGTNPFPNWVAAKVLLKPRGRVYLAYTRETQTVAGRLRDSLMPGIPVDWENDCFQIDQAYDEEIFSSITERLKGLSGTVGLNYTGGTKMMSVHAHRAMRVLGLRPEPVFTYLDARTLAMKFDGKGKDGFKIDLCDDVRIGVKALLKLHDDFDREPSSNTDSVGGQAATALVGVHCDYIGQAAWQGWCKEMLNNPVSDYHNRIENVKDFLCDPTSRRFDRNYYNKRIAFFDSCALPTEAEFQCSVKPAKSIAPSVVAQIAVSYRAFLQALSISGGETLKEVAQRNPDFRDSIDLAKWSFGLWLEHHTLDQIKACQSNSDLNPDGIALNLEPINREKRKFEADVIALRGYQLFYFSCYSGSKRKTAKTKLFEATVRAAQLGGDEATVALVCCGDKSQDEDDCVESVKREVEAEWQKAGRVRVFGRKDLPKLSEKLQKEWFNRR